MNIILAEQRAGAEQEYSFSKGVVLIGRDAFECDIAFDSVEHPMVSRKHAELRWQDGRWFVVDLNSSYGTFVNGQRISQLIPIAAGHSIQFGVDGPLFRVVWFEESPDSVQAFSAPVPPSHAATQHTPHTPVGLPPPAQNRQPLEIAQLEFVGPPARPSLALSKPNIWLGREPACDIVFDSSSTTVPRKHAEIRLDDGSYVLHDNNSFNGTLLNEQRLSSPVPLYDEDEIQLGIGGPVLRFNSPSRKAPAGASLAGQRSIAGQKNVVLANAEVPASKTIVFNRESSSPRLDARDSAQPQLLMSISFGDKKELSIGRADTNDITLDGLQMSKRHARLLRSGGETVIDDLGSTNGVYVNGVRVSRQTIHPADSVQIGSFVISVDAGGNVGVYDTRSKTRIDAANIVKRVKNRSGGGQITLLDGVSLSIQPNEFVGFLGPSGAGKSTLIEAMNGMRPATSGNVLVNNLDLYRHLDSLKQSIGYVPQDDIIHRELTVYRTLYYVAKLRLSRDVSSAELNQIVCEVMDVTGLAERRDVPVNQLSGGQRKRVSMAVELVTKPSIIFLDEPTSGLDPATEEKIMKLFHQIAESGRTVIMTTHAMENVRLFDKIVVLMRGKLVFYGKPSEALVHLGASSFKDLYERLEQPIDEGVKQHGESNRKALTEQTAESWKEKFLKTPQYKQNVEKPLAELGTLPPTAVRKKHRLGIFGAFSQWLTLSRRYFEVLLKDKLNLFILLAQAPAIALLTFFVMGAKQPRDFVYFVIALVAFWFGTSVSAREIIRERPVYKRERMVNLGILPYLASKLFVLGIIVSLQCVFLFVPLKLMDLAGLMPMPGDLFGIPQFWTMILTAAVGIALGLLISALVSTSEMATSLVPLLLIPQILFSGLVGVPSGINKAAGLLMPAAWSFDTMKRFSGLDTLEPEGANPKGRTKGEGLYKSIETENEKMIEDFKTNLEDYKKAAREFQADPMNAPTPQEPEMGMVKKIPDNLSGYVTFLHPWMNEVVNQIVLMLMFGLLVLATLIILRLQDLI